MYDNLREMLGANAEKGIDERFKELLRNDSDELEELMEREHLREQLEPKYVIVKRGPLYEFRARYVDMHRTLLSYDEIRQGLCDGGGFWGVDGEKKWVTLYDSSSDFGFPKHIEEAIRADGARLLKILGRVCDKSGEKHDLTDYRISYMYRDGRHIVEPPYGDCSNRTGDIRDNIGSDVEKQMKRLSREDYERFGLHTNYTPPSGVDKKKRKRKAKQQKQSRRNNRR